MDAGEDLLPDLGTAWLKAARNGSTITFDHFDLHMVGRAGPDDYTSSRTYIAEVAYMVTFEFDDQRFDQLLRLLPKAGKEQLQGAVGGPFVEPRIINIPPGAIIVGMRTRLGAPRVNEDESYVPLVVTSMFAPGPIMSIAFEEVDSAEDATKLEVIETGNGPAHGIGGVELKDGDLVEVWLNHEKSWVAGKYASTTTTAGAFEQQFALLHTEHSMRPFFVGYRTRRVK